MGRLGATVGLALALGLGCSAAASASSTSGGTVREYGDPNFQPDAALQAIAERWVKVYEGKLGPLGLSVVAGTTTTTAQAFADTLPVNAQGRYSTSGPLCRVRMFAAGMAASAPFRGLLLAHEVFHCFEIELTRGNQWVWGPGVHRWITEGMADWAALTVDPVGYDVGGGNLTTYINNPQTPLFDRSYDAAGFWGHVEDVTHDLWTRIQAILNASSDQGAYNAAGGDSQAVLSAWGSSVFHTSAQGWSMTSPIKPPVSPAGHIVLLTGGGMVNAAPYTTSQYKLEAVANAPLVHVSINGYARLSTTLNIANPTKLENAWFCIGSSKCTCPPGSSGEPPPSTPLPNSSYLGLTGAPSEPANGAITSYPLSVFCKAPTPTPTTTTPTTIRPLCASLSLTQIANLLGTGPLALFRIIGPYCLFSGQIRPGRYEPMLQIGIIPYIASAWQAAKAKAVQVGSQLLYATKTITSAGMQPCTPNLPRGPTGPVCAGQPSEATASTYAYGSYQSSGQQMMVGVAETGQEGYVQVSLLLTLVKQILSGQISSTLTPTVDSALGTLLNAVNGIGPGTVLAAQVTLVKTYADTHRTTVACGGLSGFINDVSAQVGKKITTAQAGSLIAQAENIQTTLHC